MIIILNSRVSVTILSGGTRFYFPFGGLVKLVSKKRNSQPIKVRLENVVESPYYDLLKPELCKKWSIRRFAPGLWATLASKHVVITLPSSLIRNLENPESEMRLYDRIVEANHQLRGTISG